MKNPAHWLLLKDTRRMILRWWNPLMAIIVLLWLLQLLFGRYSEAEGVAISWIAVVILPGTILLLLGSWLNKYPEKIIPPGAYHSLKALIILYLSMALLTLLLIGLALRWTDLGHKEYLSTSLFWLAPVNVLVIIGIVVLFYRKETGFRPNTKIIQEVVQHEVQAAKNQEKIARSQCLELIANNNLEPLFSKMNALFENKADLNDHLVLLQNRLNSLQREINLNTIEPAKAQISMNQIIISLINLTKEINF